MLDNIKIGKQRIAIIGGDLRQIYLAILLMKQGYPVTVYGNQPSLYQLSKEDVSYYDANVILNSSFVTTVKENDVLILPIPLSKDSEHITMNKMYDPISNSSLLQNLTHKPYIFAGAIKPSIRTFLQEHEVPFCDFMELEPIAIENAIATAEGTIVEAISRSNINLNHSNVLVLGYGRCAKILASKLKGMDAIVTIAARKADALAYAKAYGFNAIKLPEKVTDLSHYDYIFNTIPTAIISRELLQTTKSDVTIIDIASAPGGVDFAAAKELGINASLCLALPGIYAPKASATILSDAILELIITE